MKKRDTVRQDFLKTFFEDTDQYEEKLVNGYWLVKWNNAGRWVVSIKTKEKMEIDKAQVGLY